MTMPHISQLLESALADEPPYVSDAGAVLRSARRSSHRRRAALAGSVAALGSAGVATASVLVSAGGSGPDTTAGPAPRPAARAMSLAQVKRLAAADVRAGRSSAAPRGYQVQGITASSLPDQIERAAGVRLSGVSVDVLPPVGDIDLAAGIASAQGQYLNVQVTPAGTTSTTPPACADIGGNGPDGDGYTGACTITPLDGGGYVVARSGRTADGTGAETEADLVASDGSGIFAECDNRLAESIDSLIRVAPSHGSPTDDVEKVVGVPRVVSAEPPLTSAQLEALVRTLAARR